MMCHPQSCLGMKPSPGVRKFVKEEVLVTASVMAELVVVTVDCVVEVSDKVASAGGDGCRKL